jgi:hypothetical protein
MTPPNKTSGQRLLYRVGLWICALVPAALVTAAIQGSNADLRSGVTLAIFTLSWIASYFVAHWAMFERSAELRRKYPVSSKELRRRQKEFYDNLPR